MTQQEKQLLIKDLCARLPYGVMVHFEGWNPEKLSEVNLNTNVYNGMGGLPLPYLRPMSSMTEEEREEIEVFIFNEWFQEDSCKIDKEGWIEILANYDVSGIDPCFCSDYVDWLNEHHFDYRGLIEKGLALEAKDGMYETE